MTVETFGVERVGFGGYRHAEFGKRVEGVLYPRGCKLNGWVGGYEHTDVWEKG